MHSTTLMFHFYLYSFHMRLQTTSIHTSVTVQIKKKLYTKNSDAKNADEEQVRVKTGCLLSQLS